MIMITRQEALGRLNQRLKRPISNRQFSTIYTLMAEHGLATPPERGQRGYITDEEYFSLWCVYLQTRENLIDAGLWVPNRPYSIRDMEDIALVGMYEDYQPSA